MGVSSATHRDKVNEAVKTQTRATTPIENWKSTLENLQRIADFGSTLRESSNSRKQRKRRKRLATLCYLCSLLLGFLSVQSAMYASAHCYVYVAVERFRGRPGSSLHARERMQVHIECLLADLSVAIAHRGLRFTPTVR